VVLPDQRRHLPRFQRRVDADRRRGLIPLTINAYHDPPLIRPLHELWSMYRSKLHVPPQCHGTCAERNLGTAEGAVQPYATVQFVRDGSVNSRCVDEEGPLMQNGGSLSGLVAESAGADRIVQPSRSCPAGACAGVPLHRSGNRSVSQLSALVGRWSTGRAATEDRTSQGDAGCGCARRDFHHAFNTTRP
jgi:hypothetical protein